MPLGALDVAGYERGLGDARAGRDARALHRRPGRAARRAHRPRHRAARERARRRTARRARGAVRADRARDDRRRGQRRRDAARRAGGGDARRARWTSSSIGDPAALAAFRQGLRRWLAEAGAAPEEVQDIVMACNEACQNAIEHAYGLAPEPFDVAARRATDGEVAITVRDRGGWRDSRLQRPRARPAAHARAHGRRRHRAAPHRLHGRAQARDPRGRR